MGKPKIAAGSAPTPGAPGAGGAGTGGAGAAKGCTCSKKTSAKNKKSVRKKVDGKEQRCSICNLTRSQSAAKRIRELGLAPNSKAAKTWRSFPMEADHKFPADKIKAAPGFADLEEKNPKEARRIMTLQSNIRPLCKSCNSSLQDTSGFQGTDIKNKIQQALGRG